MGSAKTGLGSLIPLGGGEIGPSLSGLYESPCPRGGDLGLPGERARRWGERGRPIGESARRGGDNARRGGDLARSSRADNGGGEPAGR